MLSCGRSTWLRETDLKTQTSSVLMIDISHSMILIWGRSNHTCEERWLWPWLNTFSTKYPKGHAWTLLFLATTLGKLNLRTLPYLQVGPYHTNTVAGLQARSGFVEDVKRNPNKQILMITDGKPSCLNENGGPTIKTASAWIGRLLTRL